ncbi:NAD(P)-dependent dehydrogenase (short-subunit alcohol dehydrogenase family) [Spirosoma oryzae]|uniref:NAD(P)-dependent dehydrogenase (Short-subunit alcohol dehydrogenase family) n=1 Tax=Spirosoma oryzae TaxID=1469603 RepID=A0A2T0SAI5_9BACT|nr:glucose 1-dehydrogenase [Spirosoma oryzae]PRY30428.1 NAD(P)-dependent dehydrogenase (short-subunit alcohol dehydrogenase family) [Spirosoma oryzae]
MESVTETTKDANKTKKVALITGGTTGIGKETALILASRGVQVVVSGRREEAGKELVNAINAQGGEASFVFGDVNQEDSIKQMIEFTVQRYGRLDMAVNNAGITLETKRIGDSDPDLFEKMLHTNVMGVFLCMKYQINQMLENGGGSIVNLASIAGLNGMPYSGAYAATKHAVVGLTKSGALDYATDNIRINAIAPGTTNTEIIAGAISLGQYDYPTVSAMQPMNRMGNPSEMAEGIAWLLSDSASFVTGHILSIDGGFQAK